MAERKRLIEALLGGVEGAKAVIILMDDEGNLEVGTAGLGETQVEQDRTAMFMCFSLSVEIAEALQAQGHGGDLPTTYRNGQTKPLIYLPPKGGRLN